MRRRRRWRQCEVRAGKEIWKRRTSTWNRIFRAVRTAADRHLGCLSQVGGPAVVCGPLRMSHGLEQGPCHEDLGGEHIVIPVAAHQREHDRPSAGTLGFQRQETIADAHVTSFAESRTIRRGRRVVRTAGRERSPSRERSWARSALNITGGWWMSDADRPLVATARRRTIPVRTAAPVSSGGARSTRWPGLRVDELIQLPLESVESPANALEPPVNAN